MNKSAIGKIGKKGLKFTAKFLLLLVVFLFFSIQATLLFSFIYQIGYKGIFNAAPAICEIPNPVPAEVQIIVLENFKKEGIIEEKNQELFFSFSNNSKIVLMSYGRVGEIIFRKFGDMPGELKSYSYRLSFQSYFYDEELSFKIPVRAIVKSDIIEIRHEWSFSAFVIFIVLVILAGIVIYYLGWRPLTRTARWAFKKDESAS